MIELRRHHKDIDFSVFDYVFVDVKKFEEVLPFLLPKLEGTWNIALVEPKSSHIHRYLDTETIPSYISLVITVERKQLEQIYLERPQLVQQEKTNWDIYMGLISTFPVPMEDKALREVYYRRGPKEEDLRAALDELLGYSMVTMREVNKHFAPVNRVYANQVVRAFLLGNHKQAWRMLSVLELELGATIAFYALRKNVRRVFAEKCKYLQNEDITDRLVEMVDGYSIVLLYWLFENAEGPEQLIPTFLMFERRQLPCW